MTTPATNLQQLVDQARSLDSSRIAVVNAAQGVVIETLHEADAMGFFEPCLIGTPAGIQVLSEDRELRAQADWIIAASTGAAAAAKAIELASTGKVDAVMKGQVHIDTLMHALRNRKCPGCVRVA